MLLRPVGLKMSLLPSSGMCEEKRKNYKPIALGALDLYPDMIKGSIGIPADVLSPGLQTLIAALLLCRHTCADTQRPRRLSA